MRATRLLIMSTLGLALLCSFALEAQAEQLAVVHNDGRGGGYRRGGTYAAIKYDKFGPNDRVGYRVLSGSFRYWTVHARYNGGFWKTIYKGPKNFISMAQIRNRVAQLGKGRPTHLNFSVNGAHERYDRVACRLAIVRRLGAVPPPVARPGRGGVIQIVSGTYGQNCGVRRGNKTAHLRRTCQGRSSCVYTIDYRVIGDPRRGCGKNYVAEWRCSGSTNLRRAVVGPEAGYRKKLTLTCGPRFGRPPGHGHAHGHQPPPAVRGAIHVVSGTYGRNCGAPKRNKTAHLRRACEGRRACVYTIDYRKIGDPRPGCAKNYIAEWRCGRASKTRRAVVGPEAGFRKKVTLSCGPVAVRPPPPPARPAQAYRLFRAVAKQSSNNFKHNRHRRLRVATNVHDRVPYHMAPVAKRMVTVHPGQRIFLAGNAAGTAGFGVDNFLYLTIGSRGGHKRRFFVGTADPVTHRGRPVARLGSNKFRFRAGEIDLTPYFPKGVPTRIKVSALDYGVVGFVSDVFLIVR